MQVAAVLPLITVAGCGQLGAAERPCTAMGALSGVSVLLDTNPALRYRLCAGASCVTGKPGDSDLMVRLPDSVGARSVTVRLTGSPGGASAGSTPTVDERTEVTLKRYQPNGPQCPPTVYHVGLRYEPGQGLVPVG
ncbi:hypothetical protein ABZ883_12350 [Streptomyces sp. NPDC046977]|uniref:hypothetical protein n=1 Tax=Streptomyces sp. NPDC046977 TaxID=3154703 RepID=UPI0033D9F59D